jgi:two-component system, NtrC family, response regulator AtoC
MCPLLFLWIRWLKESLHYTYHQIAGGQRRSRAPAQNIAGKRLRVASVRKPLDDSDAMDPAKSTLKQAHPEAASLQLVAVFRGGAKTLAVVDGATLIFGRAYPADMVVDDASVSRQHATLRITENTLQVSDMNSTNGVWLNGRRVPEARVPAGESVRVGDVMLILQASPSRILGIDGYDVFAHWLEQELARASTFARPLALLSIQVKGAAAQGLTQQLGVWSDVGRRLRSVDRMGMYAPNEVLVGLPETTHAAAETFASEIVKEHPEVRVSVAQFPLDARTLDQLLAAVRANRGKSSAPAAQVESDMMIRLRGELGRVAASKLPVLLVGETGVGKELLARQVHEGSPRKREAFVTFNCASVPQTLIESVLFGHEKGAFTGADKTTRGVFEQANTGTLFLDEVGELSSAVQAALLRVLETSTLRRVGSEREIAVDVRIVAATHRNLEAMVREGSFREDLLFRLEGALLRVPPLRERVVEIEPLALSFLRDAGVENARALKGFTKEALAIMQAHTWTGNVRELRNAVFRAAVIASGEWVDVVDLPERVRGAQAPAQGSASMAPQVSLEPGAEDQSYKDRVRSQMDQYERTLIEDALHRHGGNQTAAAADLKIPVRTLAHKIKELGLK